jgi:hypothetical protein
MEKNIIIIFIFIILCTVFLRFYKKKNIVYDSSIYHPAAFPYL